MHGRPLTDTSKDTCDFSAMIKQTQTGMNGNETRFVRLLCIDIVSCTARVQIAQKKCACQGVIKRGCRMRNEDDMRMAQKPKTTKEK